MRSPFVNTKQNNNVHYKRDGQTAVQLSFKIFHCLSFKVQLIFFYIIDISSPKDMKIIPCELLERFATDDQSKRALRIVCKLLSISLMFDIRANFLKTRIFSNWKCKYRKKRYVTFKSSLSKCDDLTEKEILLF